MLSPASQAKPDLCIVCFFVATDARCFFVALSQQRRERLDVEGFGEVSVETFVASSLHIFRPAKTRQRHRRQILFSRQLAQLAEKLKSIHSRHRDIRQHHIKLLFPRDAQRFKTTRRNCQPWRHRSPTSVGPSPSYLPNRQRPALSVPEAYRTQIKHR